MSTFRVWFADAACASIRTRLKRIFLARAKIKPVNSTRDLPIVSITGSCHCGKIAFEIDGEIPPVLTRCTCFICSKRGHLYAYYEPHPFRLTITASELATHRWNTELVAHNFCPECGCGTFFDSPAFGPDGSWDGTTRRIGVNARLFDNFDAAATGVQVIDGKSPW